jgi:holo-[acyl-carrier protein] synthase
MIIGLGSDIVDIRRVAAVLERHGARFTQRLFTDQERAKCDGRVNRAAGYARRFAAKEACAKALGTGFRAGVFWKDLGVINLPGGKPAMVLTGGARRRLDQMVPAGLAAQINLSLTDDAPYAHAIVIISAIPATPSGLP